VCDDVEGIVALRIFDIRIGAMGNEQLDDIKVTITSRPLHGSSDEVSAEGIDFRALLEEVATRGDLGIDSCPVKGSDVLFIVVRGSGATGLYELPNEVEVPTLSGHKDTWLLQTILSD
jgi:hypothetical protein